MLLFALACTQPQSGSSADTDGIDTDSDVQVIDTDSDTDVDVVEAGPLQLRFLAVGGVALTYGDDRILTPPLYSNPGMLEVTFGDIESDPDVIDQFLDRDDVDGASAILVGHAHYDHLLDVPHVQALTGGATVYGNRSTRNILAGTEVDPADVVAVNDPIDPRVDMRMCSEPDPCTGLSTGQQGAWIDVPGTDVRIRAVCSTHPAQILDLFHFGEGCIDEPLQAPPARADDWLEGATLAWLVDFLDDDGEPVHRVFYQDAPTTSPTGHVHPELLREKRVDVAVLNVGSFDAVDDFPREILLDLDPRYVVGVHWEDFFRRLDQPPQPIPFHPDPAVFDDRVLDWLPTSDEPEALVNGMSDGDRYWRPLPGTDFTFPPE